jgi:hypothetical protein
MGEREPKLQIEATTPKHQAGESISPILSRTNPDGNSLKLDGRAVGPVANAVRKSPSHLLVTVPAKCVSAKANEAIESASRKGRQRLNMTHR